VNEQILDRELRDVYGQGPQTAPGGTVDRALLVARGVQQRRPRFARLDPRAWPPQRRSFADPQLRRSTRLVLVAGAALLLAAVVVIVGAQLLQQQPVRIELTRGGVLESRIDGPRAVALPDGRVLVYGQGPETIFDPATGSFGSASLGPIVDPEAFVHPSGRVLLVGSTDFDGVGPRTIGFFDPKTSATTVIAEVPDALFAEALAVLDDGRLLMTGGAFDAGQGLAAQATVRVFDPATGASTELAPLAQPRNRHSMVVLEDDRILIVGGFGLADEALEVEIYDLGTGRSDTIGLISPVRALTAGSAIELADGRVLVPGGLLDRQFCGDSVLGAQATWIFDPASDALTPGPHLPHPVEQAVALRDGRFMVFGIHTAAPQGCASEERSLQPWIGVVDPDTGLTLETLDPTTGIETLAIQVDVNYGAAVGLPDGRVALIGDDFLTYTNNAIDILSFGP
jgi:hypothetical protein